MDEFKEIESFDDSIKDRDFASFTWVQNQNIDKDHVPIPDYLLIEQLNFFTENMQERFDILDILKKFKTSLIAHGFTMCQDSVAMLNKLFSLLDFTTNPNHSEIFLDYVTDIIAICFRDHNFDINFITDLGFFDFLINQMCSPDIPKHYRLISFHLLLILIYRDDAFLKQALATIPFEIFVEFANYSNSGELVLSFIYLVCRSIKNLSEEHVLQFLDYFQYMYQSIPLNQIPHKIETESFMRKFLLAFQSFSMSSQKFFRESKTFDLTSIFHNLENLFQITDLQKYFISKTIEIFTLYAWHPSIIQVNIGYFIRYMKDNDTSYSSIKMILKLLESFTDGKTSIGPQIEEAIANTDFIPTLLRLLNEGPFDDKKNVIKVFYLLLKNRSLEITDDLIIPEFIVTLTHLCDDQKEETQVECVKIVYDVVSYALKNSKQDLFTSQIDINEIGDILSNVRYETESKDLTITIDSLFELFDQF